MSIEQIKKDSKLSICDKFITIKYKHNGVEKTIVESIDLIGDIESIYEIITRRIENKN